MIGNPFFLKSRELVLFVFIMTVLLTAAVVAQVNTKLTISITASTLALSILDASNALVASPSVTFNSYTRANACGSATGSLGVAAQKIRISNPGAADNGWTLKVAAQGGTTSLWTSSGDNNKKFDFNDPGNGSNGCTDKAVGGDTDGFAGQLTVNASGATLTAVTGSADNISKGASAAFNEGTTDSITLLNAAAGSSDFGSWDLTGVALTQKIPANQVAASDYELSLQLTLASQ